jgi:hypothetical protein
MMKKVAAQIHEVKMWSKTDSQNFFWGKNDTIMGISCIISNSSKHSTKFPQKTFHEISHKYQLTGNQSNNFISPFSIITSPLLSSLTFSPLYFDHCDCCFSNCYCFALTTVIAASLIFDCCFAFVVIAACFGPL